MECVQWWCGLGLPAEHRGLLACPGKYDGHLVRNRLCPSENRKTGLKMYIYIWLRAKVPRPMNLAATASSLAWGSLLRSQWWSLGWLLDALNAKNAQKGTPPPGGGFLFGTFPLWGVPNQQKNDRQIWHHIQRLWKQDQLRSLLVPYLHNTAELSIPNFDPYL